MNRLSEAIWRDVLAHVRTEYPGIARAWFGSLKPGPLAGGHLTITVATKDQKTYLDAHCIQPFTGAAQAATGRLVSVSFETAPDAKARSLALEAPNGDSQPHRASFERESPVLRLNADYRFDHFVTGPCNQLAHASSLAVSEAPGQVYNPLFIHGNVGLGKTHLLQAVCHKVLDDSPGTRIMYLTCETFVNHFIEAIEHGALHSFRYRYRYVDLLVIDDIQFLARRERTQDEFFHTFNTLYQKQKQIILTADCPPSDIPSLEERLTSRFNWGLVARIDPPCLETRLAIIRMKSKLRGIALPDDLAMLIAARIKANTRELEGAITRIQGLATLHGGAIDRPLVEKALGEHLPAPPIEIRVQDIMNAVMEVFSVKLSDLRSRRRSRSIVFPRQVCMYLARQYTPHSLEEIGGFFGGRDHTTVLHANRLIARRRETDIVFRSRLEGIEEGLRRQ
ncbi:MAG: chromosomal replication initiator protein DnaA [Phycisphaerae bacterium]